MYPPIHNLAENCCKAIWTLVTFFFYYNGKKMKSLGKGKLKLWLYVLTAKSLLFLDLEETQNIVDNIATNSGKSTLFNLT